ncbi:MAG: patatin-like phospholipase family protein, partial [Acidobacteriota bacterium]|nr:patatin-like phospholipase family protein [Acidobacteriota bacterium]
HEILPLALLLTGGGARASYQVGVLRAVAKLRPDLEIPILTGVSAGGINATFLASAPGGLDESVQGLCDLWLSLDPEKVFRVDASSMLRGAARWILRLGSGGSGLAPRTRGLVDTSPLRTLLESAMETVDGELVGVRRNLEKGRLAAVALSTVDYGSGRTIVWSEGSDIETWTRPYRRCVETRLRVDHVMASAALPMLFPAVRLGGHWYGDGGVRLTSPLSPAIHLGARRILAVSTRYQRSWEQVSAPAVTRYPPPAQVAGVLLNAIFLDLLDQDALHLERTNELLAGFGGSHDRLRHVDLVTIRPSADLGRMASDYESQLPGAFRFFTRGLGTRETKDSDLLSLLMFQRDYTARLIDMGEADAMAHSEDLLRLFADDDA